MWRRIWCTLAHNKFLRKATLLICSPIQCGENCSFIIEPVKKVILWTSAFTIVQFLKHIFLLTRCHGFQKHCFSVNIISSHMSYELTAQRVNRYEKYCQIPQPHLTWMFILTHSRNPWYNKRDHHSHTEWNMAHVLLNSHQLHWFISLIKSHCACDSRHSTIVHYHNIVVSNKYTILIRFNQSEAFSLYERMPRTHKSDSG